MTDHKPTQTQTESKADVSAPAEGEFIETRGDRENPDSANAGDPAPDPNDAKASQPALPGGTNAGSPKAGKPIPADELTEEEQMALYEEALKEDDWGHQPC